MEFLFQKGPTGLISACEEATEWLSKKKLGATIMVEPRELRNGKYFKKWWALVKLGYDHWSERAETIQFNGEPVKPEFDRFRKDVTISAGFYYPVVNLKGEVRIEPESLKWSKMTEDRFRKLYDATVQVLLDRVFNGAICKKWTAAELKEVVRQIMDFT